MSPECLKDLNFIMNHLCMMASAYKARMRDFLTSMDEGIAAFLAAESKERYELSEKVADYIQANNGGGVRYTATPAPLHGQANVAALQTLLTLDKAAVDTLAGFISAARARGSDATMIYMSELRDKCQKEYSEVKGVLTAIAAISSDPGPMVMYNYFLEKEYGSKYDNPRKYH